MAVGRALARASHPYQTLQSPNNAVDDSRLPLPSPTAVGAHQLSCAPLLDPLKGRSKCPPLCSNRAPLRDRGVEGWLWLQPWRCYGYGYSQEVDEIGNQTGTKALLRRRQELSHTSVHLSSIQHINKLDPL
jgi:hypothetical protein